jgi:hypothetical protein
MGHPGIKASRYTFNRTIYTDEKNQTAPRRVSEQTHEQKNEQDTDRYTGMDSKHKTHKSSDRKLAFVFCVFEGGGGRPRLEMELAPRHALPAD